MQQKELERQKEVAKLEEMIDDLREDLNESERMLDESERMVVDLTSRLSDRLTNLERGYVWEAVEEEREKHEGEKASWQAQAREFKAEIRQERQRRVASEHSIQKEHRQLQSKVAATERELAAVRQQVRLIVIILILDARRSYKTFNTKTY